MTLKLQVKIKGIQSVIDKLKQLKDNTPYNTYIYPVFIAQAHAEGTTMLEMTEFLIKYSLGDFVEEGLKNLTDYTDKAFQESIIAVLTLWGQNPPLTERPLARRKKLNVGDTPRNIITGEYVRCFGLGFSKAEPADIPTNWIRKI